MAAQDYLVITEQTLEVIAELTGFADGAHLSRVFKEGTGMAPSQFRRHSHPTDFPYSAD